MESPFQYIMFSLMVSSAALAVTFFIAWNNFGKQAHALTWAFAYIVGTLQWGVTLNSSLFPSPEFGLLTEYVFSVALIMLLLCGHCQRTERGRVFKGICPLAGLVYAIAAWFILVQPHAGIVRGIVPAFAGVTLLLSSFLIVSYRDRTRPSEWAAAICIALFGLAQLFSGWIGFSQGALRDEILVSAFMHFTFMTLPGGYMIMSTFVILMMASDISERMKEIAVRDQLTGLLNRRGFNEHGEKAFSAARRAGTPLSVIMTDIDRFKCINDKFGHAAGDLALVHFAKSLVENRRKEDIVARIGGEEFALLLPGAGLPQATMLADRLCEKVGSTRLDMANYDLPMTSSFGVATISDKDTSLDDMIRRADRALYRSKRAGRNQIDLESSQLMLAADGSLTPLKSS